MGNISHDGLNIFMSDFYGNGANPTQPEYGKAWKPENNFGCCTTCGQTPDPPTCSTISSRRTRTNLDDSTTVTYNYNCPCQGSNPVAGQCQNSISGNDGCG